MEEIILTENKFFNNQIDYLHNRYNGLLQTFIVNNLLKMLLLAFVVSNFVACDTSENPALLNPPVVDSSYARVVNLSNGANLDMKLGIEPIAQNLPYLSTSTHAPLLTNQITEGIVTKGNRTDTIFKKNISKAVRITYFVFDAKDSVTITEAQAGKPEEEDLKKRGMGKIVFVQGVNDSLRYFLKSGCQNGDTLFSELGRTGIVSKEVPSGNFSLYLFAQDNPQQITNAELTITDGEIIYLIAAKNNNTINLYQLPATRTSSSVSGNQTLGIANQVSNSKSKITFVNVLSDSLPITAKFNNEPVELFKNLSFLSVAETEVSACSGLLPDSLSISTNRINYFPIKLKVKSEYIAFVTGESQNPSFTIIEKNISGVNSPQNPNYNKVGLYLLNGLPFDTLSLTLGAGLPKGATEGSKPFTDAMFGKISKPVILPTGSYPLLFNKSASGKFIVGGFHNFQQGEYILAVLSHSAESKIYAFNTQGVATEIPSNSFQAQFFNMNPDSLATFEFNNIRLQNIPFRYASTTLIPQEVLVKSNLGEVQISNSNKRSFTIGAVGNGLDKSLVAIESPNEQIGYDKSKIRFFNAATGADGIAFRNNPNAPVLLESKKVSQNFELDAKKYSFFFTKSSQDITIVGRLDGLELRPGKQYLLIIGNSPQGSELPYSTLLLQEN